MMRFDSGRGRFAASQGLHRTPLGTVSIAKIIFHHHMFTLKNALYLFRHPLGTLVANSLDPHLIVAEQHVKLYFSFFYLFNIVFNSTVYGDPEYKYFKYSRPNDPV